MLQKRKIKVLHLICHMNDGGAQRIVLNYLSDFKNDESIEMKVLVYGNKTNSIYDKIIKEQNYNVDYLFEKINNKLLRKIMKIVFGEKMLTDYIKKYNPDIVHVHISSFLKTCLKPIIKCKVPIKFDTLHSNPFRFNGTNLKYIKEAFQKDGFIGICVTNEQVEQAKEHYGLTKYEVVHNGVDFNTIKSNYISKKEARTRFKLKDDEKVIIGVGRLNRIKRFDYLIKIFSELVKVEPNSKLLLAGSGVEKEKLIKVANELNVIDKVVFLGNISNVHDLYRAADVLVITSENESSSLVLLEAQSCNLKCVISNGVPSESIISNNVRKMEEQASESQWVEAILDDNYKGEHKYTFDDYEVHHMSEQLKQIYIKYWREYNGTKEDL